MSLSGWRYLQCFEAAQTLEHASADRLQLVSVNSSSKTPSAPSNAPSRMSRSLLLLTFCKHRIEENIDSSCALTQAFILMGLKCAIYYSEKWQKAQVCNGTLQFLCFHYMNTLWLYPKHTFMMIHRLILTVLQ